MREEPERTVSDQESLILKSEKYAIVLAAGFFISAGASFSAKFQAIEDVDIGLFFLGLGFACSAWALRRISCSAALISASIGVCTLAVSSTLTVSNVGLFSKNNWSKSESSVPLRFSL
jgi:hypothetical protein